MDCTLHYDSPLGGITIAGCGGALVGLWFDSQQHFGEALSPEHCERPLPVLCQAARWLDIYFGGGVPDFTPPLELRGTAFRREVWDLLLSIPYGRTATYGQLAERISMARGTARTSARVIGGAVARNPISLIVPCHRVIGAGGALTGYAAGTERKARLLALEC